MQPKYGHVGATTPLKGTVIEPTTASLRQGVTLDPRKLLPKGFRLVKLS